MILTCVGENSGLLVYTQAHYYHSQALASQMEPRGSETPLDYSFRSGRYSIRIHGNACESYSAPSPSHIVSAEVPGMIRDACTIECD